MGKWRYLLAILVSLHISCSKDEKESEPQVIEPEVFTVSASTGTNGGVNLFGSYDSNENTISEIGFEYSLDSLFNTKTKLNSEIDSNNEIEYFLANGIKENTKYFYKAFVRSSLGIFFGDTKSFLSDGSVSPQIDSISTELGVLGDTLEIYGRYFKDDDYGTFLDFSEVNAEIISLNESTIKCKVPLDLNDVESDIHIRIDNRSDSYSSFTLLKPQIESIAPLNATFREEITITGDNFDFEISRNKVFFGNIEATVTYADRNTLKVIVPDDLESSSEPIKVIAQLQEVVFNENFELIPPEINFAPQDVNVNQEINIEGSYFHPVLENNKITIENIEVNLTSGSVGNLETKIPLGPFPRRKAIVRLSLLDLTVEYEAELNISDKWVMVSKELPFRFRRGPQNAVVVNGHAYVLAKELDIFADDTLYLWKFNPEDFTWERLNTEVPEGNVVPSGILETDGTDIYYYTANTMNAFWRYSVTSNTWQQLSDFPGNRRDYSAHFSLGTDIYIGMGTDIPSIGSPDYVDFYKFNVLTDEWSQISDIPLDIFGGQRRMGINSFVINNVAYLVGGASNTGDFDAWSYEPNTDTWDQIADFPLTINESAAFPLNGQGFVTGGGSIGGSRRDRSWVYSPSTDSWEESDSIIEARGWHFSFVLNGRAYIGGGDNASGGGLRDSFYEYIP